jgi:hypothetical protein
MVKESALSDLRRFDHLINYVYLSALEDEELDFSMLESVALLYMPVTLHHAFLEGTRVLQLVTRAFLGSTESIPPSPRREPCAGLMPAAPTRSRGWAQWPRQRR